jgi:hypothetical protein
MHLSRRFQRLLYGFMRLERALGVPADPNAGDAVNLSPIGLPRLQAVIDYKQPNFLGLRTTGGLYRFFGRNAFGAPVGMSMHLFAKHTDAQRVADWQRWLDALA